MNVKRTGAVAALLAVGILVGFLLGPSLVNAAGRAPTVTQVQIKDDTKSYLASVSSAHRLTVDTEADTTALGSATYLDTFGLQFTQPNGQQMLGYGQAGCNATSTHQVVIASININSPAGTANPVTATVEENVASNPQVAYQTTFNTNEIGSHDFSFDGGVYFQHGFKVVLSAANSSLQCQVIGQDLGVSGAPQIHATSSGK
jgi:hypothetical protein